MSESHYRVSVCCKLGSHCLFVVSQIDRGTLTSMVYCYELVIHMLDGISYSSLKLGLLTKCSTSNKEATI